MFANDLTVFLAVNRLLSWVAVQQFVLLHYWKKQFCSSELVLLQCLVHAFLDSRRNKGPEISFVEPGTNVEGLYAMYKIGLFYNDDSRINLYKNPIDPKKLTMQKMATDILGLEYKEIKPKLEDRFWVNLIGKGYPAPRRGFRWCTDRLKIKPSNDFIKSVVNKHGEAILLLGVRSAESASRARSIKKHTKDDIGPERHRRLTPR